eukprot:Blabericola_migrator_1__3720@NODE_2113_length_3251_cov_114_276382_g1338_i0_p1_GENE_NODE_2113_length_3251_cov_114_276382_g1338_i0NODE_2113_length_3251_cov_114_276382_g1338_i0_p1_ORF_typecomplete_len679_score120_79_NODE_2113_length_3251_cov_114_276382_g1338_i012133027
MKADPSSVDVAKIVKCIIDNVPVLLDGESSSAAPPFMPPPVMPPPVPEVPSFVPITQQRSILADSMPSSNEGTPVPQLEGLSHAMPGMGSEEQQAGPESNSTRELPVSRPPLPPMHNEGYKNFNVPPRMDDYPPTTLGDDMHIKTFPAPPTPRETDRLSSRRSFGGDDASAGRAVPGDEGNTYIGMPDDLGRSADLGPPPLKKDERFSTCVTDDRYGLSMGDERFSLHRGDERHSVAKGEEMYGRPMSDERSGRPMSSAEDEHHGGKQLSLEPSHINLVQPSGEPGMAQNEEGGEQSKMPSHESLPNRLNLSNDMNPNKFNVLAFNNDQFPLILGTESLPSSNILPGSQESSEREERDEVAVPDSNESFSANKLPSVRDAPKTHTFVSPSMLKIKPPSNEPSAEDASQPPSQQKGTKPDDPPSEGLSARETVTTIYKLKVAIPDTVRLLGEAKEVLLSDQTRIKREQDQENLQKILSRHIEKLHDIGIGMKAHETMIKGLATHTASQLQEIIRDLQNRVRDVQSGEENTDEDGLSGLLQDVDYINFVALLQDCVREAKTFRDVLERDAIKADAVQPLAAIDAMTRIKSASSQVLSDLEKFVESI